MCPSTLIYFDIFDRRGHSTLGIVYTGLLTQIDLTLVFLTVPRKAPYIFNILFYTLSKNMFLKIEISEKIKICVRMFVN